MKRMIIASDEMGHMEWVGKYALEVELPDRIILTSNGAYDLEKEGINGVYTWVGYRHRGSRSEAAMAREVKNVAYNIVAPAIAEYCSMPEDNVHVEDFIDKLDMFRIWIECAEV